MKTKIIGDCKFCNKGCTKCDYHKDMRCCKCCETKKKNICKEKLN